MEAVNIDLTEDPPFLATEWIKVGKKFPAPRDIQPFIRVAYTEAFALPPERHTSLLPGSTVPVQRFIAHPLPFASSSPDFMTIFGDL